MSNTTLIDQKTSTVVGFVSPVRISTEALELGAHKVLYAALDAARSTQAPWAYTSVDGVALWVHTNPENEVVIEVLPTSEELWVLLGSPEILVVAPPTC